MVEDGFRWAPKSLMNRLLVNSTFALAETTFTQTVRVIDSRLALEIKSPPNMMLVPEGFTFSQDAIVLSNTRRPVETRFFYQEHSTWYQVDAEIDFKGNLISASTFSSPSGTLIPE